MNIIKPSFLEIKNSNPQKHIEEIARTCYKSTDLITEDSHKQFVKNIYNRKHWAMLEHYIFCYIIKDQDFVPLADKRFIIHTNTVLNLPQKPWQEVRHVVSFSARSLLDILEANENPHMNRVIIELIEQVVYDYDCDELFGNRFKKVNNEFRYTKVDDITTLTPEEQWTHGWKSIKFICDRGVSHEIVRHRDASFAQESTRYCNYAKDKFGKEITVIKPCYLRDGSDDPNKEMVAWGIWTKAIEASEKAYFEMLDSGCTPQEARAVLPNSLKTEVIMTARNYEWGHFFGLRCDKPAHSQMRELAIPLFGYFNECDNTLFNRDTVKFED